MITRITGCDTISVSDSYYGKKIASYHKAYGADYEFCRFYKLDCGTILVYNSIMVIDSDNVDDEMNSFVMIISPISIEISNAEKLDLPAEYERKKRTLFEFSKGITDINLSDITVNTLLDGIYAILKESFGIIEYDAWYADISHRIRHKTAQTFLYEDKVTATMQFCENNFAFFSHIAADGKYRGQEYARRMLYCIADELNRNNIKGYLFALGHRESFYRDIGFTPVSTDILLEKNID